MEHEQANDRYASTAYQSAAGTAIAAGVFALVIAVLLGVQSYRYVVSDAARAVTLEKLKEQAKANPANVKLSEEVTALDTQLRRNQLARMQFLRRGTLLLVGTLALGIGAVVWAKGYNKELPMPGPAVDVKSEQIQQAQRVRTAVTAAFVLLAGGALFWSLYAPEHQSDEQEKEPALKYAEDLSFASMEEMQSQWPTFRGPQGLGICRFASIPTAWDAAGGKNVLWKTALALPGHSSPVVWGKRIFLTAATDASQKVFCVDTETGRVLWSGEIAIPDTAARAKMNILPDTGYAACSPVTDGRRVCAVFAGGDIGCFTVEGKPLWQKHLGIPESAYGYAASLTAFEKVVIVQWDVGYEAGQSKLMGLDWQTGQAAWETPRLVPNSWSSPTVVKVGDTYRVLTAASPYVIAYDPKTGGEVFRAECIEGDIAATPIIADGKILTMQPYQKLVAVKTEGASGDVTATHIAWQAEGAMPDICSPVSNGTFVWTLTSDGTLGCYRISDGSEVYSQSLGLSFQASPVLAEDKLYILAQNGTMIIAAAKGEYKELGRCTLNEDCFASPAFAEGRIYIRAKENLYCVGVK